MRGERAQPAAAFRGGAPPVRHLTFRVGEDRQVEDHRGHARLADEVLPHRARGQRLSGRKAELGAEHVHHIGGLRRRKHRARLAGVARERLLAQHVLAGRHGLQHEAGVRMRRRGDGDDIYVGLRQRLGQ